MKALKYNIELKYKTGNSYRTYDEFSNVCDIGWDNLDIVKENLKRIKEHYLWQEDHNSRYGKKTIQKPNWVDDGDEYSMEYTIKLLADNGVEYKISTFWIGYFERLISGKVIFNEVIDDDLEFEI